MSKWLKFKYMNEYQINYHITFIGKSKVIKTVTAKIINTLIPTVGI